jgi:8-oxo-dGTP diphosphatase
MPAPITPRLAVDAVICDPTLGVVLIRRANPPFQGRWALPGGFVELGESCEAACRREAQEETGLRVEIVALLGVYSAPARDPRGHTASAIYLCRPVGGRLVAADDASEARWFGELQELDLAFDHARVLADAGFVVGGEERRERGGGGREE